MFLSQPTTVAPGQGPAPAPAPAQPSQGAPAPSSSSPMDGGPLGGGMSILFFLLPLLFVFLMTRSQSKKQKEIEASLKPGDVVVTQSGLIGKIVDLGEVNAKLEIAPGVNVRVRKSSIQGPEGDVRTTDSTGSKDKANEKKA